MQNLVSLEQRNQTDRHMIKQLKQLCRVNQAIFGESPLAVNLNPSEPNQKINVAHYVNFLTQRFPALT